MKLPVPFVVLFFLLSQFIIQAQTPPSNVEGLNLRKWLKSNYYDGNHQTLGYSEARRKMYNFIDNKNNSLTGVYSGFQRYWAAGGTGTNPMPINAEHTVPQSFFDQKEPMRSDIHHLFPTYGNWNSVRSNHKFAEISDAKTTKWMRNASSQSTIPQTSINDYCESNGQVFEPREQQKGNTARAVFYFYTMYPGEAGNITDVASLETLYKWHLQDPVDSAERSRNNAIAQYQGDRNPFIDQPNLVARAWGFQDTNTPTPLPAEKTLFISEYLEGSSNNKAIEIANQTGNTVSLKGYSLRKQTNGSGSWSTDFFLSGTLYNGQVFVVSNSNASDPIYYRSNWITGNAVMTFNGNDPIGLFKNGKLVDIVGFYSGGSTNFAKDRTLIRKAYVTTGKNSFNITEWKAYVKDTYQALGNLSLGRKLTPLSSSIEGLDQLKLYLSQDKSNMVVEFKTINDASIHLTLLDTTGRIVQEGTNIVTNSTVIIPVNELSTGVYIVKINGKGINSTTRFVAP